MKKTVILTVGTRPEVIKMAPVYKELLKSEVLRPVLLSTGQHREMLAQALSAFDLEPDADLALMQPGQTLPELTGRVINAVADFIQANRPDAILVQGDTTTVLAAAIAATYARVPVGHVEAGLRTYDMAHPFPEEMNRRLVSPLTRWSFVPTETSRQNLLQEHISAESIHITGNSVIDALFWMREKIRGRETAPQEITKRLGIPPDFASKYFHVRASEGKPSRWILVTGHRRESFGGGFESICQALRQLVEEHSNVGVLYPVHLNPNVREPVNRLLSNHPRIALIEPVGYEDFICLMDRCFFLLSDSGGVQEEAPSLGKPVLVMRTTTERPEGVEAGTCRLVGTDPNTILEESNRLLHNEREYARRAKLKNPYGDGKTSERIRNILERAFAGQ
jgi:UDP-N-acetylglucosamine 2-epimerase (non-hydrolysing)